MDDASQTWFALVVIVAGAIVATVIQWHSADDHQYEDDQDPPVWLPPCP